MQPRSFKDDRQYCRVMEQPGFGEIKPVRVPQRAMDEIAEKQQTDVGQHQRGQNLIGVVAASWIVGAFSFIPGGIGAKEGSFAFFLGFLDVSLDIATTVGLMARIINILICSTGFFASSLRLSVKLADIQGPEIDPEDESN